MIHLNYKGARCKGISFPLGGIGSGCIGLGGDGRLIDWEIFNRPNKRSLNGFSHFAVKAESRGKVLDARVLHGDLAPPYSGEDRSGRFGHGPAREQLAGLPHFRQTQFNGEFPIATLQFRDDKFPGDVQMVAFNPFIPLNDKDSSIPAAFFETTIKNTATTPITYSICLSVQNPLPENNTRNVHGSEGQIHFVKLASNNLDANRPEFGDLTIATDAPDVSYQEYWLRGQWFDNLQVYWREFSAPGKFKNRHYEPATGNRTYYMTPYTKDVSSLAAHFLVNPKKVATVKFIISWNFPNCSKYWTPDEWLGCSCSSACDSQQPKQWRNYYANMFEDSTESAIFSLQNWGRLYQETVRFKNALFSSTMPPAVLDAISANLSILKTSTVLRLEDGAFYGWEGCSTTAGCCEGSCTHVWNYAYALPFLYPVLERSMRDLDFNYNLAEDGRMSFRLQLPLGAERWSAPHACPDGQFGGVMKTYRDWKISGDSKWLKSNWHAIKKSIEYAWAETNIDRWDLNKDGILEGRQHNTLDMELFGPNSWLSGFYLGALKAASEMAQNLGEVDTAKEYHDLFQKGKKWADKHLFNGEYYSQVLNVKNRQVLEPFKSSDSNVEKVYWDQEHEEIKYQIGEGCEVDQVIAQWHANICGLGEIFNKRQTKKALTSIFKYNFKKNLRNHVNPCRVYGLNDEAGLVICEWPKDKRKPAIPVPYAEETWCGYEYAAASHMIQEGLVDEALEIVSAVRARYDGEKRNPWNEIECGSNYARSMSSYALLLALSGFQFDMVKGCIGFDPVLTKDGYFKSFWCLNRGWGTFVMKPNQASIKVEGGELEIQSLRLPFLKNRRIQTISLEGKDIEFENTEGCISFRHRILIRPDMSLKIRVRISDRH